MSPKSPKITEADLHAYLDGVLEEARRAEVEAYLAGNPAEAGRVRAYQMQNEALQRFARSGAFEPIPRRLRRLTRRSRVFAVGRVAAAAVWLLVGIAAGWGLAGYAHSSQQPGAELQREARIAHLVFTPEVVHPVEVKADQEKHLVAWLSKRVGARLVAPSLPEEGFHLVGGRLLASDSGPAAQFMLENAAGTRLTWYVKTGGPGQVERFHYIREGKVGVITWSQGRLEFALSGDLERPRLMRAAEFINLQLPQT